MNETIVPLPGGDLAVSPSNRDVVAELNRVKVLFQARTIALVIGAKPPEKLS